jgi:hypothetical protein
VYLAGRNALEKVTRSLSVVIADGDFEVLICQFLVHPVPPFRYSFHRDWTFAVHKTYTFLCPESLLEAQQCQQG